MRKEERATKDDKRSQRKRKIEKVGYVIALVIVGAYLTLFIRIALVGYLTWIATTAGIVFFASQLPVLATGLMGRTALAKRLGRIWGCVMIAAMVVLGALFFWPEPPGPWKPYRLEAELAALEAKRAVPDEENAALRYGEAFATVNPNDRPEFAFGGPNLRDKLTRQPWRREDHPQVSDWLDSYAAVVTELLRIGEMEHCRWPILTGRDGIWPVPYSKLRHGAYLLTLAGNRHLGEGHLEEALNAYFALLRQTDHLQQQTFILDFQCSYDAEETALGMIRYVLVHNELSHEDINRIAHRLPDSASTWQRDAQRLVDFEEFRFVNYLARAYEINEEGKIRFTASLPHLTGELVRPDSAWKRKLSPLYYYANMPLDPQDLWPMARDDLSEMRRFLEAGPLLPEQSHAVDPPGMFSTPVIRGCCNILRFRARDLAFDAHAHARWGERYAENLTRRRGTWLVLGLRKYRNEHGAWPQSLDQVAEHVRGEALLDPTRGERFVYSFDDDGFTLYGTGINCVDEGGRWDGVKALDGHEDDIAIWPPYVPEPQPQTETEAQEGRDEMIKQLTEIYGQRYVERMLSEPNDR